MSTLPSKTFVWTPKLAYIVGLLTTDGNLSKDGRHIIMRSSDKELLEKFRKCLSINNKIALSTNNGYAKKPSFRIQFGNVIFYRWLMEIGLFPAKTYTLGQINIQKEFFRDFLRGHLDGDGTVMLYTDTYNFYRGRQYSNQRLYVKFISASEKHIIWLSERIHKLAQVKGSVSCNERSGTENKAPIWEVKFAKKESVLLLNFIYYKPNLPCLKRKMKIARKALKIVLSQKRKPYSKIVSTISLDAGAIKGSCPPLNMKTTSLLMSKFKI